MFKMKFILGVLLLSVVAFAQENVVPIICPVPGNPDPTTVTEDQCNTYTACEYTSGICHMKQNNESGYLLASEPVVSTTGIQLSLKKANPENTLFGADIEELTVDILYHHNYHFEIKIYDSSQSRYEVPIQRNLPDTPGTDPIFEIRTPTAVDEPFYIDVRRKSTGSVLFRTVGPLTFEDQFIQLTSHVYSPYFYGIGEICHSSLLRSFDERITNVLFARDRAPYPGSQDNLYGSHPYYINIEDYEGNTHSVFLDNSNAIEYSTFLIGSTPSVTIRTIGGILDFHFFLGPTPDDVTVQYTEFIGRPFLPPYWSLGFQLSRYGYNSLDNYKDTQYFDIDYMDGRRDFTYDETNFATLPDVATQLHSENMKLVLMFDPAIAIDFDTYPPSQRGKDSDVYVKYSDPSYIPDDQPASTSDYVVGNSVGFDGVWIDMNEPSNFGTNTDQYFDATGRGALQCPDNNLEKPPYGTLVASTASTSTLSEATICMSSKQTDGTNDYLHYDVHNIYGFSESVATYRGLTETVLPGERPFVLTRSSFPGTGQYVAHWLGDNKSAWEDLKASIIARPDWPNVLQASKDALTIRYKYLPFLYTSLHRAHMFGNSAIRPVFSVFPSDLNARGIDDQFFWSDKLLVAPVVEQGATGRYIYLPNSLWYDLLDGTLVAHMTTVLYVETPIEKIPLYVKGGSILPFQSPSLTTVESRNNPFGLTIALDSNNFAEGELFWDDGHTEHTMDESYIGTFTYDQGNLTLSIQYNQDIASDLVLTSINVYGYPFKPI
ncbi:hypothetical protein Anas_05295 [Armadillidium nasatum]|uniref:Maltase n=1 Tax=Armadillidium nasatum TaxID=96803 RepID=A0A5N5SPE8_9CRUS|nr:hypothetical protein Anas_05295 [Armadillidium nasatum]